MVLTIIRLIRTIEPLVGESKKKKRELIRGFQRQLAFSRHKSRIEFKKIFFTLSRINEMLRDTRFLCFILTFQFFFRVIRERIHIFESTNTYFY